MYYGSQFVHVHERESNIVCNYYLHVFLCIDACVCVCKLLCTPLSVIYTVQPQECVMFPIKMLWAGGYICTSILV